MTLSYHLITLPEDCDIILAESIAKREGFDRRKNMLSEQIKYLDASVEKIVKAMDRQKDLLNMYHSLAQRTNESGRMKKYKKGGLQIDSARLGSEKSLLAIPDLKIIMLEHELTKVQLAVKAMDEIIACLENRKMELVSAAQSK